MKILYAVQATGNGHIARATELMPFLQRYGDVDVFLSGSNSSIDIDLPVAYRSKGLSLFYGHSGGLNYGKMIRSFAPGRIMREAYSLPVEKYDVVINDFEAITSLACKQKRVPFIHFGHQASFVSAKVPRPEKKDIVGEWLLHHYASSANNVGLHFESYDNFICSPIIKKQVLETEPLNKGHITVYLSHYSDAVLEDVLSKIKNTSFHIFSKEKKQPLRKDNLQFIPVNNKNFTESLINCEGVITGAGFETPAEALYLGKKLMCLPIRGQYEQYCNAASLKAFDVPIIPSVSKDFATHIESWLSAAGQKTLHLQQSTANIIEQVITKGLYAAHEKENAYAWLSPVY
jgi:uncharacterized protein (TIGR00661 family)